MSPVVVGLQCARTQVSVALAVLLILHLITLRPSLAYAGGAEIPGPAPAVLRQPNSASAQEAGSAFALGAGRAEPTPAGLVFCQRMPTECTVDLSEPAEIPLTPEVLALLRDISQEVNAAIMPMTDREHWGVGDRWDFAEDGYGDCEDFQLVKRKRLIEKGLPRRALRLTVVLDQSGEGHAVLMVRTTSGDLVLDNKTPAVLPWRETGYRFVKHEGQDGRAWVSLVDPPRPAALASR